MRPLTVEQISHVTGGRLSPSSAAGLRVQTICTDTRTIKPGSLFIAIKGEKFDAHEKLHEAAAGGAVAAIVERIPHHAPPLPLILVDSSRRAMGALATHVRKQLAGKVIAVGGSNGKTSTKSLIHSVLSAALKGSASPKSFNNDIGVPLAIFPADPADDYLVLEIGTNHPGEVRALSEMALPDIAVITSIAAEHLEGLGDIDGVRREEAELIAGLNPRGTLIVNGDDEKILALVSRFTGSIITFGFAPTNDLVATDIECLDSGVRFRINGEGGGGRRFFVPMLGKHVASNALAAVAVALEMGLGDDEIVLALSQAHGPDMRLELQHVNGMTILNDAYNANPASMRAALETVCEMPAQGRRVAVVGDMRELGEHAEKYHREAGEFVGRCKLDVLVCVGEHSAVFADAARAAGMRSVYQFKDVISAARFVPRALRKGDLILFKASRGVELENVVKAVQAA